MLQHNTAGAGQRAHVAHAAVVALHALCCGVPVLALMVSAASGATSGFVVAAQWFAPIHRFLHAHEIWILALSAALVCLGGTFEVLSRRDGHRRGFPMMFAISVGCFFANAAIIAIHRA